MRLPTFSALLVRRFAAGTTRDVIFLIRAKLLVGARKTENRKRGAAVAPNLEAALNCHRLDSVWDDQYRNPGEASPSERRRRGRDAEAVTGARIIFYSRQLEALAKGRTDLISFAL